MLHDEPLSQVEKELLHGYTAPEVFVTDINNCNRFIGSESDALKFVQNMVCSEDLRIFRLTEVKVTTKVVFE